MRKIIIAAALAMITQAAQAETWFVMGLWAGFEQPKGIAGLYCKQFNQPRREIIAGLAKTFNGKGKILTEPDQDGGSSLMEVDFVRSKRYRAFAEREACERYVDTMLARAIPNLY